jgi:hypothetical protein
VKREGGTVPPSAAKGPLVKKTPSFAAAAPVSPDIAE